MYRGRSVYISLHLEHATTARHRCLIVDYLFSISNFTCFVFPSMDFPQYDQWLKWFCEAGGGGSPDEARLEQTPYPFQPH